MSSLFFAEGSWRQRFLHYIVLLLQFMHTTEVAKILGPDMHATVPGTALPCALCYTTWVDDPVYHLPNLSHALRSAPCGR
jgi:hypothetical protein